MAAAPIVTFVLLATVLIAAAVWDWRKGIIPNRLTLPAMAAGVLLAAVIGLVADGIGGLLDGLASSLLAWGLALVPMAVIFFAGALHGGDVKLAAALGAICGSPLCTRDALFYSFLAAAVMAVVIMIQKRIVKRTLMRIVTAAMTAAARVKPELPDDSPRVPFGAALCIGGLVAGMQHLLRVPMPWS